MSKIFRTRAFVVDKSGMNTAIATLEVDTQKQIVEFRAAGYTVTTSIDKVKKLISEYTTYGATTMKEDNGNQTLIRYTKGIARKTKNGVTMSLSHVDETENEVYMITADASEFDKYMRSKLYEKPRT
jgi:hypothetical protein